MTQPVVVQGTAVSNPYVTTNTSTNANSYEPTTNSYEPTSNNPTVNNNQNGHIVGGGNNSGSGSGGGGGFFGTKCNDPIFAVLFYINVIAIAFVAVAYGGGALSGGLTPSDDDFNANNNNTSDGEGGYTGYIVAVVLTGIISLFASGVGLAILMKFPETIIKMALIFVVVMMGIMMVISFLSGNLFAAIMGAVFFAIMLCYVRVAWPRIPFATINLVTAITAIQANLGVVAFNYIFAIVAVLWSVLWSVAFVGVFSTAYNCDENGENCLGANYGILFVLFLSLFFGLQVFQNSVHVTIAGVVGTWWTTPNENGFCGKAVMNSFIRYVLCSI